MTVVEKPAPVAARASGSSFYYAMRILPQEQRKAMFEIYSFCRAVDDIADSDAPQARRLDDLAQWRLSIDALYAAHTPKELEGLESSVERFDLAREDFHAVIDGMEMDAAETMYAPDLDRLDHYCDCVASAVGRLSVRVFGMELYEGRLLAYHLGRALQLTNILRDIDEDAEAGRLYLPREALRAAGIDSTDLLAVSLDPALDAACMFVVERARDHYAQADEVMARCPRRHVRAPRIMGQAYRQLLEDMVLRGWAWPRIPVHISRSHLLRIALRHAFA
ncbi:MAG TPA: presqualene diphosphate synthase HpnD [Pseudolabrys sp.]|nr:presqualene diphosphate synthase HpnD [Pseudolabrys sp.]